MDTLRIRIQTAGAVIPPLKQLVPAPRLQNLYAGLPVAIAFSVPALSVYMLTYEVGRIALKPLFKSSNNFADFAISNRLQNDTLLRTSFRSTRNQHYCNNYRYSWLLEQLLNVSESLESSTCSEADFQTPAQSLPVLFGHHSTFSSLDYRKETKELQRSRYLARSSKKKEWRPLHSSA